VQRLAPALDSPEEAGSKDPAYIRITAGELQHWRLSDMNGA